VTVIGIKRRNRRSNLVKSPVFHTVTESETTREQPWRPRIAKWNRLVNTSAQKRDISAGGVSTLKQATGERPHRPFEEDRATLSYTPVSVARNQGCRILPDPSTAVT